MTHVPLTELPEFARNVRTMLKLMPPKARATVVYLKGDLGAGKTTFVQEIAKDFGIEGTVQSPTYVLMKSYKILQPRTTFGQQRRFTTLVHIDAYRLEKPEEFAALRPEEFLADPKTVVFIEWPEKTGNAAPEPDMVINFSSQDAGERERYIEVV